MRLSHAACLLIVGLILITSGVEAAKSPKPKSPSPKFPLKPSVTKAPPPKRKPSPKPKPSPSPPHHPKCPSAILQLADYDTISGVFSKWHHSVTNGNMTGSLVAQYNKLLNVPNIPQKPVLILPTNAAFDRYISKKGMPANVKDWTAANKAIFIKDSLSLIVPWRVAKTRWPKYFTQCTLLGVTHDMLSPLNGMHLELWNGKGPGLKGSLLNKPPQGRKLSQTTSGYGVAGQGYNTLTGFPNSYSGGGIDPGFTGNPVFSTASGDTPVGALPQGSCTTQFSSSSYATSSSLYDSSSTSLGASANYEGASFSANVNYNTMTSEQSSAQQSSFILSGQSTLGGYSINAAAGVPDSYYLTAVGNMCEALSYGGGASSEEFQSQLTTFAESYGSSYIKSFYYGGYAASVLQMSSSSYSSLQNQSISLSAAASVTFIQSGGSVSGSYDGDMSVGSTVQDASSTFQYIQIPSSTLVALTSSGDIDCTTWTGNLQSSANSGVLSPMSYTIGNQSDLLVGYPWYFPSACSDEYNGEMVLNQVAAAMVAYFSDCSNSEVGCPPPGTCPIGSYGYALNQTSYTCVYCYDQNNLELSPMCNVDNTESCAYQQCNCVAGYTSESQCNTPDNPTPSGTCVGSFTGYGCNVESNDCGTGSTPTISYCQYTDGCSCGCCTASGCTSEPPTCTAPPSPSPPPSDCFPGGVTVDVLGRGETRMENVVIGDKVLSGDAASGKLSYRSVYLIPHREATTESTYVNLEIGNDAATTLLLSPRHFLPVCTAKPCTHASNWENRYARDIVVGDIVRTAAAELAGVTKISLSIERGSFNPFVVGGTIVVNGVLASDQSDWILDDVLPASMAKHIPAIYSAIVAPARWAFWVLGAQRWAALDEALGVSWMGHNHGKMLLLHMPMAVALLVATAKAKAKARTA